MKNFHVDKFSQFCLIQRLVYYQVLGEPGIDGCIQSSIGHLPWEVLTCVHARFFFCVFKVKRGNLEWNGNYIFGTYKAGVRDLQPMVRKCTSVPSNTISQS